MSAFSPPENHRLGAHIIPLIIILRQDPNGYKAKYLSMHIEYNLLLLYGQYFEYKVNRLEDKELVGVLK